MATSKEFTPIGNYVKNGMKHDSNKPRLGLVFGDFARALMMVGEVGTFGADKYSDSNWLEVNGAHSRYTDAMLRHLMEELSDELYDNESGLNHAAHTAWNALARLELELRSHENNE